MSPNDTTGSVKLNRATKGEGSPLEPLPPNPFSALSAHPGALLRLKPSRFYSSCLIFLCATPCRLGSSTPLRGAFLGGLRVKLFIYSGVAHRRRESDRHKIFVAPKLWGKFYTGKLPLLTNERRYKNISKTACFQK